MLGVDLLGLLAANGSRPSLQVAPNQPPSSTGASELEEAAQVLISLAQPLPPSGTLPLPPTRRTAAQSDQTGRLPMQPEGASAPSNPSTPLQELLQGMLGSFTTGHRKVSTT